MEIRKLRAPQSPRLVGIVFVLSVCTCWMYSGEPIREVLQFEEFNNYSLEETVKIRSMPIQARFELFILLKRRT